MDNVTHQSPEKQGEELGWSRIKGARSSRGPGTEGAADSEYLAAVGERTGSPAFVNCHPLVQLNED